MATSSPTETPVVSRVRIVKDGVETHADFYTREDAQGALDVIKGDWYEEHGLNVESDTTCVMTICGPNKWFAEVIDL